MSVVIAYEIAPSIPSDWRTFSILRSSGLYYISQHVSTNRWLVEEGLSRDKVTVSNQFKMDAVSMIDAVAIAILHGLNK